MGHQRNKDTVYRVLILLRSGGIEPPQVAKSATEGMPCDALRRNVRRKQSLTATAAGYFPQGNYLHDSPVRVTNTKSTATAVLFVLRFGGIEPTQVAKSATEGVPCDIFGGVNYTIKCNTMEKKKTHIESCVIMKLPHSKITEGEQYELYPFYHRRTLLSTGILQ